MNITILTANLGQNNSVVSWNAPVQQTTILERSNPNFLRSIQLSNDGIKIVRGSNQVGMNTSTLLASAILVDAGLTWPPFFNSQPTTDQIKQTSQVPNIQVAANSEIAAAYKWQSSADFSNWSNLANGGDYSGVTTNNLGLNTANTSNFTTLAKAYRVNVLTAAGQNNSNASILSLVIPPTNASVAAPNPTSFSISAYGISNFSYYWQKSSDGGNTYTNVAESTPYSNTTTNHVNISNSTGLNAYRFRCVVNDSNVSLNGNAAVLTVT